MNNPYPICENCIFVDESLDKDPCQECNRVFLAQRIKPNFISKRKPKTNADRLRAMSDEELAEWMYKVIVCSTCPCSPCITADDIDKDGNIKCTPCENILLKWLKQRWTNDG